MGRCAGGLARRGPGVGVALGQAARGFQMNEGMKAGLHLPCPLFQVALETLLLRGPQKPRTHPLASYRYTGEWSTTAGVVGPG